LRLANHATAKALEAAGLSPLAAAKVVAVREAGEVFVVPEDIARLGLDASDRAKLDAAAIAHAPSDTACSATDARLVGAKLLVTPDEGDAEIIARIDAATKSIEIVMYTFSSFRLRDALLAAAKRGVAVRLILDRAHDDVGERVKAFQDGGVLAKASAKRFAYTHQKTMVVDGRSLFVFTGNFDRQSFTSGRNFGAFLRDPEDIWDAEDLFLADWNDDKPDLACTRLVVAPDNASERIEALIDAAQTTIEVEALYASDATFQDALVRAKKRGVAVRVLFNDPKFEVGDATDEAELLGAAGIVVRRSPVRFIHAKLVVVDGKKMFVGSENFSTNSLQRNREVGVILDASEIDLATVNAVFEKDFAAGASFVTN